MKKLIIILAIITCKNCYSQKENNYSLLATNICNCFNKKSKELNLKHYSKCMRKVNKNKNKLVDSLKNFENKSTTDRFLKHFSPLKMQNKLLMTLFKECEKFKKFTIKLNYEKLKNKFIKEASQNICEKINANKTKYHDYWEASYCITPYFDTHKETILEFTKFYFYNKKNASSKVYNYIDVLESDIAKNLRKECNYFNELYKKLGEN